MQCFVLPPVDRERENGGCTMLLEIRPRQSLFGTATDADVQEVKFNIEHLERRITVNRLSAFNSPQFLSDELLPLPTKFLNYTHLTYGKNTMHELANETILDCDSGDR